MRISVEILRQAGLRYTKEQLDAANEYLANSPNEWHMASMYLGDASACLTVIQQSIDAAKDGFVESSIVENLLWDKMDTAPRDELREIIIITVPEPGDAS